MTTTPAEEASDHATDPDETRLTHQRLHLLPKVEHTYTPQHVFLLQETLAVRLRTYSNLAHDVALDVARGLLTEELANLSNLNVAALAAASETARPDTCDDGSCDGPRPHEHGPVCGHLCGCEKGS